MLTRHTRHHGAKKYTMPTCPGAMAAWRPSSYRHHRDNSFASASPAVDARGVYATWTTPEEVTLVGLDHNGKEKWRRRFGGFESRFGSGASPIAVGDLVLPVDVIDQTTRRPKTMCESSPLGTLRQFPVFCPALRDVAVDVLHDRTQRDHATDDGQTAERSGPGSTRG